MQPFGFSIDNTPFLFRNNPVPEHFQHFLLQRIPLNAELIAESRRQQCRRNGKYANAKQREYDGHRPARRGHGRNIPVAHAGERDHSPIYRGWNVLELVRLRLVLKQITEAGG